MTRCCTYITSGYVGGGDPFPKVRQRMTFFFRVVQHHIYDNKTVQNSNKSTNMVFVWPYLTSNRTCKCPGELSKNNPIRESQNL